MDSDQAVALLRARNRYVRQLPSGLWARVALPRIREALASGDIPMPVLHEMAKLSANGGAKAEGAAISSEALAHTVQYQQAVVLRSLKGISETDQGLEEDTPMTEEVVAELSQEDFDQIFAWADRNEPIDPKAVTSE